MVRSHGLYGGGVQNYFSVQLKVQTKLNNNDRSIDQIDRIMNDHTQHSQCQDNLQEGKVPAADQQVAGDILCISGETQRVTRSLCVQTEMAY